MMNKNIFLAIVLAASVCGYIRAEEVACAKIDIAFDEALEAATIKVCEMIESARKRKNTKRWTEKEKELIRIISDTLVEATHSFTPETVSQWNAAFMIMVKGLVKIIEIPDFQQATQLQEIMCTAFYLHDLKINSNS